MQRHLTAIRLYGRVRGAAAERHRCETVTES